MKFSSSIFLISLLAFSCGRSRSEKPQPSVSNPPYKAEGSLSEANEKEIKEKEFLSIESQAMGGFDDQLAKNISASVAVSSDLSLSAEDLGCTKIVSGDQTDMDQDSVQADSTTSYSCSLSKTEARFSASGNVREKDLNDNDALFGSRHEVNGYHYDGSYSFNGKSKKISGSIEGFTERKKDGNVHLYVSRLDKTTSSDQGSVRSLFTLRGFYGNNNEDLSERTGAGQFEGYFLYQNQTSSITLRVVASDLVRNNLICGENGSFLSGRIILTDGAGKELVAHYKNCQRSFSSSAAISL